MGPNPDQVARQVMPMGETMQRLAGQISLRDLPLEFDAVGA